MKRNISIAIDGPAGAGKSSVAKRTAQALGYLYVDTGAIYRSVAYHMSLMGIHPKDTDRVRLCIDDVNLAIRHESDGQHMLLNGSDITQDIRTPEISQLASGFAAQPCVRQFLLQMQRDMAKRANVVMDGRDIGTVVLPNADVKIFLTASAEVRAQRRLLELGDKVSYDEVLSEIKERDYRDTHRATAPLRQAQDAVLVDASALDLEQTTQAVLDIIRKKVEK